MAYKYDKVFFKGPIDFGEKKINVVNGNFC